MIHKMLLVTSFNRYRLFYQKNMIRLIPISKMQIENLNKACKRKFDAIIIVIKVLNYVEFPE